jgi:PAS domain S-box-containing protein
MREERPGGRKSMSHTFNILLLEDNSADAELIEHALRSAGIDFTSQRVETREEFRRAIKESRPDVILSDFNLPQFTALDALRLMREEGIRFPFILVTGTQSEEVAVQCIQEGADDYILKSSLTRLPSSLVNTLKKRKAEEEKEHAESKFRSLVEQSLVGVYIIQNDRFQYVNPKLAEIFGYTVGEIVGEKTVADLVSEWDRSTVMENIRRRLSGAEQTMHYTFRGVRKDQSVIDVEVLGARTQLDGQPAVIGTLLDITDRKQLEEQLRQAQKMESIGTLAGGIAHDFNNILGIILGYTTLLERGGLAPEKIPPSLDAIHKAVHRGSTLVRQLLTFARKTDVLFEPIRVGVLVEELLKMLEATFPKTITFRFEQGADIPPFTGDSGQIHQALLNLCVNARDAMPDGGHLTLRTSLRTEQFMLERFPGAQRVPHVQISVTDTGTGMSDDTRLHLFEPFFTTKEVGKGTGLGLAVVYGVVKGHRGFIDVQSKPGKGTTFHLYLPVVPDRMQSFQGEPAGDPAQSPGGNETVLLVEDEQMLVDLVRTLLEDKGYTVLVARDGVEGIEMFKTHRDRIGIALVDIGLPRLNGLEVIKSIRSIDPAIKCIVASGYLDPERETDIGQVRPVAFLQKPFLPHIVLQTLRRVLDGNQ